MEENNEFDFDSEWANFESKAVSLLQKLIQTDTQNRDEEGTEIEAVRIIQQVFDEYGVEYEVIEPKPGRGNIIARLRGDGSGGGALCLSAHLDTVLAPAEGWEAAGWKHSPYSGLIDEEDGCLYGRGAIDMKQMAAMCVMLVCYIKQKGLKLSRDIIFAGIADEERSTSAYGIKYLIENRPEVIEADIVFTELGGISLHMDGIEAFSVMIGEKGMGRVRITATGPGGHGSTYHKVNPIATVGEVAKVLATKRLPLRVVPGGRASIESMANALGGLKGMALKYILSPIFSDFITDHALNDIQVRGLVPLIRNTANPTIVEGGENPNQIPTKASIIVDGRILPGCTVDDLTADIKSVIGPERFQVSRDSQGNEVPAELSLEVLNYRYSYEQDPNSPELQSVVDIITTALKKASDGAPVFTNMISGGTDLTFYAQHPTKKPLCIGFEPTRLPPGIDLVSMFHGVNERIPVEGFKWGMRVMMDVVGKLCF